MEENPKTPDKKVQDNLQKYFFWITAGIVALLLGILLTVVIVYFAWHSIGIFEMVAIALIIIWLIISIIYFSWAIYFYNVNLGLTDSDWETIKGKQGSGNSADGPSVNPQADDSMGLPPGTIRGMTALTMLIGGLALTIVYYGKGNTIANNENLVDFLDFFKTAFLMVIAFYFGSKSLEQIWPKDKNPPTPPKPPADPTPPNQ